MNFSIDTIAVCLQNCYIVMAFRQLAQKSAAQSERKLAMILAERGYLECALFICMDHAQKLHEVALQSFERKYKPFGLMVGEIEAGLFRFVFKGHQRSLSALTIINLTMGGYPASEQTQTEKSALQLAIEALKLFGDFYPPSQLAASCLQYVNSDPAPFSH